METRNERAGSRRLAVGCWQHYVLCACLCEMEWEQGNICSAMHMVTECWSYGKVQEGQDLEALAALRGWGKQLG